MKSNKPSRKLKNELPPFCEMCGFSHPAALSTHRVKPGRCGGAYELSNVVRACLNCHRLMDIGHYDDATLFRIIERREPRIASL